MPLYEVYSEVAKDFDQRVKQVTKEAKITLSIYPHNVNDDLLYFAVKSILRQNEIDAYTEVPQSRWKEIINKHTLFNAILDYHFSVFDAHISRQTRWLNLNDVFTAENDIRVRQHFLEQLHDIRAKTLQCHTPREAIQFKLKQITELSAVITKTDFETLKDSNALNIIDVISSILKLFRMKIFSPLYFDPIISNKCLMGNSFSTLWSGKSLNNVHMEHLKAKSEQLEHTYKILSDSLNIEQDEGAQEVPKI